MNCPLGFDQGSSVIFILSDIFAVIQKNLMKSEADFPFQLVQRFLAVTE